jgi:cytochrome P450
MVSREHANEFYAGMMEDESFLTNPYPVFAALRRNDPVHWNIHAKAWYVTRYVHVFDLLVDPRMLSSTIEAKLQVLRPAEREIISPVYEFFGQWMVFSDAPHQLRIRNILRQAFTPSAVAAMHDEIADVASQEVDKFTGSGRDLMVDLAQPFALSVAARLLGVERSELSEVARWSGELMDFLNRARPKAEHAESTMRTISEVTDYVVRVALPRSKGIIAASLWSGLQRGELDAKSATATFAQLLTGGLEPVANAVGVALVSLHSHPEQHGLAREREVDYAAAVEETLRFDSPFHLASRQAQEDIAIGNSIIRRGDRVLLVLASANRDPDKFADPDTFNVLRPRPIRHVAFGRGPHYCLGSFMARREIAVLLRTLDQQLPSFHVDASAIGRLPTFGATTLRPAPAII